MKFLYGILSVFLLIALSGCSGYVQTNKLPNNVKYNLPKKNSTALRNEALNTKELGEFSALLEEFFGKKRVNIDRDEEKEKKNIYQIGIEKEYFK